MRNISRTRAPRRTKRTPRWESGTSFTDALNQYGEDTMYTDYPSFVDTGLLMYVGGEDTVWDAKLVDAVKQLQGRRILRGHPD
jgi:hypothetical protein